MGKQSSLVRSCIVVAWAHLSSETQVAQRRCAQGVIMGIRVIDSHFWHLLQLVLGLADMVLSRRERR